MKIDSIDKLKLFWFSFRYIESSAYGDFILGRLLYNILFYVFFRTSIDLLFYYNFEIYGWKKYIICGLVFFIGAFFIYNILQYLLSSFKIFKYLKNIKKYNYGINRNSNNKWIFHERHHRKNYTTTYGTFYIYADEQNLSDKIILPSIINWSKYNTVKLREHSIKDILNEA